MLNQNKNSHTTKKFLYIVLKSFLLLGAVMLARLSANTLSWVIVSMAVLSCLTDFWMVKGLEKLTVSLHHAAYFDTLTDIPNRHSLDRFFLHYNTPDRLCGISVAMIDLNDLKYTNDTYGHAAGDKLLIDFSRLLEQSASSFGFAARNGGDEFIVIFTGKNSSRAVTADFCQRLSDAAREYSRIHPLPVSYCIGLAYGCEENVKDFASLIARADSSMYKEKKLRKSVSKTVFYR